jgi:hypothetical protein
MGRVSACCVGDLSAARSTGSRSSCRSGPPLLCCAHHILPASPTYHSKSAVTMVNIAFIKSKPTHNYGVE